MKDLHQNENLSQKLNYYKNLNLDLNISRGKPSKIQLDISNDILSINEYMAKNNVDTRNYGEVFGLFETRELFKNLLGLDDVIICGNSTLNNIYNLIANLFLFGSSSNVPWSKAKKIKFLCPVPAYDRHFAILEKFGIEIICIDIVKNGIDMEKVEKLLINDDTIKGIICVPLYQNPTGICFDDDTVRRIANIKAKAKDFKIFWDNAYIFHHLYKEISLLNIFEACENESLKNRIIYFFSTSKITFAGSGISIISSGQEALKEIKDAMQIQTIGYDKINQLKTTLFLKDKQNLKKIMEKHANILRPKFELVLKILDENFKDDIILYNRPLGGYFICVYTKYKIANEIVEKCKEVGLIITEAKSTYPKGKNLNNNIRIAPSFLNIEDLALATEIFCLCVKIVNQNYLSNINIK